MFDFLFKRTPKKAAPAAPSAAIVREEEAAAAQQRKQEAQISRKEAALQQLAALRGDEAALVPFILASDNADVRLKAAEQLHGATALETVLQALRNSDRRVAKLAQGRLKDIARREAHVQQTRDCVESARQLLASPTLALNKVAELDHVWQQLADDDSATVDSYGRIRAAIGERLRAQADLQRALAHSLAELRQLAAHAEQQAPAELTQKLEQLANEVALYASAPEAHVLSKPALALFAEEYAALHKALEALHRRHAAISRREEALSGWENSPAEDLRSGDMKRVWQSLPAVPDSAMGDLQQRFDAQLQRVQRPKENNAVQPAVVLEAGAAQQAFAAGIDALEAALQEGLLQVASAQDKLLRGLDLAVVRPSDEQMMRLTHIRGEFTRLKDWAKWGGNVSREELVKAVEELPGSELPLTELARRVGSSRERWKSLDQSSGPAPKALWERFDTACTTAYAPVAAHYKQLAEERQQNQAQAQGLIDDVLQYGKAALGGDTTDWKAVSSFVRDSRLAWKRLGTVERRDKKRLDAEFDAAVQTLLQPLAAARAAEIARRESLISEAARLDSNDRGAMDALRALQARWQELAKALPLERADEQALWQRFRAACDTFFARRKAVAEAADGERQSNLAAREALCAALEGAVGQPAHAVSTLLRDTQAAWNQSGAVPRASEAALEQRYQAAVAALQQQIDADKRAVQQARSNALRDKLQLCREAETALLGKNAVAAGGVDTLQERWAALPRLAAEDERLMQARFDAALGALRAADSDYLAVLKQNVPALAEALLRQEIVAGVDSPAELAGERLKLQVEVLKASMKSGQKPAAQRAQLVALCALPAAADAAQQARLDALLDSTGL